MHQVNPQRWNVVAVVTGELRMVTYTIHLPKKQVHYLHKKRNAEEESSAPCSKSELLVLSDYKV